MPLGYTTYEDAVEGFDWDERWSLFDGDRESFNVAHECLERHPRDDTAVRIAFADGQRTSYTFGRVDDLASQFAHFLADRGVDRGDAVAVMLDPRLEFYAGLFGVLKRGAVCVPMTVLFGPSSIEHRIADSGVDVVLTTREKASDLPAGVETLFVEDGFESRLAGYPTTYDWETAADDQSFVQYTSGTTGKAQGTAMTHKSLTYTSVNVTFSRGLRPSDRFFCPSKPAWAQGLWIGVLAPLSLGNAVGNYAGKFDVETFLRGLEAFEITNMTAASTVLRRMRTSAAIDDVDLALERLISSGERLDVETQRFFLEDLGVKTGNTYGVSEFGAVTMDFLCFDDWEIKPGSIGKPVPGLDVAIVDEAGERLGPDEPGEIAIRRDGEWFRTSDAGTVDEDGYFWHRGRIDDVIITAGYRIDPYEVENVLLEHPDVAEAVVVGTTDAERSEIMKAFVKAPGADPDELGAELVRRAKEELGQHKYPREIEFVDEFPRTETGNKIERGALTEGE